MSSQTDHETPSNQSNILLESGTNELEVLIFGLGSGVYGINVAKVREVIRPMSVAACPNQPPTVKGIFNLRGRVLPLIDLRDYLKIVPHEGGLSQQRVIVTEFNGFDAAFLVDRVERIHRLSWSEMRPPTDALQCPNQAVTGITKLDDRLVLMLDFESIVDHINMQRSLHVQHIDNTLGVDRERCQIYLSEDSGFIREIMRSVLINSGYTAVQAFSNGADAWAAIEAAAQTDEKPDIVVTDIEMPMMDGLALTRRVKTHPQLREVPVLLFSSLITQDTLHKGQQVGADGQLAKPQLTGLVEMIDQWMLKRQGQTPSPQPEPVSVG